MSGDLQQMRGLVSLLEARFAAGQARLAQHQEKVRALQDGLAALGARHDAAQADDPAFRAGAYLRWNVWADERRKQINRQLAEARAGEESLKAELRVSLGKLEAARGLEAQLRADAIRKAARRAP
ncbi:MAG: hypothetical protein HLUCCA08_03520 [Rhodobacteraceae bacterium HLUCCA08]|nr:MAG: hypothetical protein HLUCCA08_03520 [Rhodobacteraceae bacterium HLUCCA08]